jgi:hypothetical protein
MSFDEFIALITKQQPSLEDISEIMLFSESADAEVIWEALQKPHVHRVAVAVLTNVLQRRITAARQEIGM